MASFSGFIRKSPSERLRQFIEARGIDVPEEFDWNAEGRGTALVRSIEELLESSADHKQDAVKAELDMLASLADEDGMIAAAQVCAGQGIDLEGFEGVQDVLLMLAVDEASIIDRVSAQASLMRRHGGRQWARFQFPDDGKLWNLDQKSARAGFLEDTVEILDLPKHRRREADWFQTIRLHPATGEESTLTQATIYVEERAESELTFGEKSLERQTIQKVMEVGISCDPQERVVEICAKGGKKLRDRYVESFTKNFAPQSEAPVEMPRRDVQLTILRQAPEFQIEPADGIDGVEVSSLSFRSSDGGFVRIEKRGKDETLYQFLDRQFGAGSPLRAGGWSILAATLRIMLAATETKRARTLTVTLSVPNTTSLPNKTEADRQFVYDLLERWNLLTPPPTSDRLVGVVE